VVQLLIDVLLDVARQRLGQRIVVLQLQGLRERGLGQGNGRADDLVLQDQVLGPQLGEPRMFDQRVVRPRERTNEEIDLEPETGTGRLGLGIRRSQ
jgi:hypothetical protein